MRRIVLITNPMLQPSAFRLALTIFPGPGVVLRLCDRLGLKRKNGTGILIASPAVQRDVLVVLLEPERVNLCAGRHDAAG